MNPFIIVLFVLVFLVSSVTVIALWGVAHYLLPFKKYEGTPAAYSRNANMWTVYAYVALIAYVVLMWYELMPGFGSLFFAIGNVILTLVGMEYIHMFNGKRMWTARMISLLVCTCLVLTSALFVAV